MVCGVVDDVVADWPPPHPRIMAADDSQKTGNAWRILVAGAQAFR